MEKEVFEKAPWTFNVTNEEESLILGYKGGAIRGLIRELGVTLQFVDIRRVILAGNKESCKKVFHEIKEYSYWACQ